MPNRQSLGKLTGLVLLQERRPYETIGLLNKPWQTDWRPCLLFCCWCDAPLHADWHLCLLFLLGHRLCKSTDVALAQRVATLLIFLAGRSASKTTGGLLGMALAS